MKYKHFKGRVIQVIEAMDQYDACSEQVENIDKYFTEHFGLVTYICSKHIHPNIKIKNYINIDNLNATESDVIIFHYAGFSEYCAKKVIASKSLKVICYHNITPCEFFIEGSDIYDFCNEGRKQLKEVLTYFDYAIGDSEYNLKELRLLGFEDEKMFLVPIIVNSKKFIVKYEEQQKSVLSHLISIGRICENKCQIELIKAFEQSNYKGKLYLVGGFDKDSLYGAKLFKLIKDLNLSDRVILKGKIDQNELNLLLRQSDALISRSEHEGFCVPLIEASIIGVPVIALSRAAVPEVLGNNPYLYDNDDELQEMINTLPLKQDKLRDIVDFQRLNFERYSEKEWLEYSDKFLNTIIGSFDRFNKVSIVICTYNRADYLDRVLDYLTRQYSTSFEVIVVNGPSMDHTDAIIDKWSSRIKIATNSKANLSISRNIGINLASGDIIAFIDDDALPFYDWVDQILIGFNSRHQLTSGLGGPTYYSGTLDFQAIDIAVDFYGDGIINPESSICNSPDFKRSLLGTNSAFRADYLIEVGGFDEEYDYFLDETDVCFRLENTGYKNSHHDLQYLRHEFAQSNNRTNKYKYNYFSIVKNTVYFALNYATQEKALIINEVKNRVNNSRVDYIKQGVDECVLTTDEASKLIDEVWLGFDEGIKRFDMPKNLLKRSTEQILFKPFIEHSTTFKKRHIVIISSEFPPFTATGGVGTLYYNLASELLVMGHKVTVIAKGKENVIIKGNFTINFIDNSMEYNFNSNSRIIDNNLNWSMKVANRIAEINLLEKVHVIDSCVWDFEAFSVSRLKEKLDVKIITRLVTPFATANKSNSWGIDGLELDNIMDIERELIFSSDAVIPISNAIHETFKNTYGVVDLDSITKVEAGIAYWPNFDVSQGYDDLSRLGNIEKIKDSFKVLFLGRLEKRKGIDVLLEAANKYMSMYPSDNITFIIAGKDLINVEQFIKENKLDHIKFNISLIGEVNLWDRDKLYSFSDIIVFPSRYESFGLVPLEAFVHGKPVIASNAGAIPEVVQDEISGLIFEDGDTDQLCNKVKTLYEDRNQVSILSKGALMRVRELSSVEMAKKTEKIYNKLLEISQ